MLLNVAVAVAVFLLAAASDYLETRYVRAVRAWEEARHDGELRSARRRAAHSSIGMWLVGCVGLIAVIEVGWFVLPFEAAGLYVGTLLALPAARA